MTKTLQSGLLVVQRITIPEIKKHSWFQKNLPIEFTDEGEESIDAQTQSVDNIVSIIQEARTTVGGLGIGISATGSMDLDDLDADYDIDDVETSGDFVCAL